MDVKLTAKFYNINGKYQRISWVEKEPKLVERDPEDNSKVISEVPMTADEVVDEFRRIFSKSINDGKKIITLPDEEKGMAVIVQLSHVFSIEISAEEVAN